MEGETNVNAYAAPEADLEDSVDVASSPKIESLATGQKLVIYSVLCYIWIIPAKQIYFPLALVVFFAMVIFGIWGTIKVLKGMDIHIFFKVLVFLLFFVPFVNLIALVRLNSVATKKLKNAGYKAGFLGAKRPA